LINNSLEYLIFETIVTKSNKKVNEHQMSYEIKSLLK